MPGIRCPGMLQTTWPRVLHDEQISGFSPLVCGMVEAPRVWADIPVGGELGWVEPVAMAGGETGSRSADLYL